MFRKWEYDLFIKYLSYFNILVLSFVNILKETIDLGLVRGVVLLILAAYFLTTRRVWSKTYNYLMIFSFYILLMGLITYIRYDFFPDKVIKVFLGSVSFGYGIYFINSRERFNDLNKVFVWCIVIIISTIVLANVMGVNYKLYADTGFSLGGQGVNIAKNLTIFLLPFPVYLLLTKRKSADVALRILYVSCLLLIIVSLKRGAMLGMALGTVTYFIISEKRGKLLRNSLLVMVVAFAIYPLYEPVLQETFKAREQSFSFEEKDVEAEGRYTEVSSTIKDITSKSVFRTLIGEGVQSEASYFKIKRLHHTDFFSVLFGAGIIGLVLYIMTYYSPLKEIKRFRFMERQYPVIREMRAVVAALIMGIAGLSLSGVYHTIDLRGFAFLYIGGCIGLMRSFYIEAMKKQSNNA